MMNSNGDNTMNYLKYFTSNKVVKIIQSYTVIVNKMVWRK